VNSANELIHSHWFFEIKKNCSREQCDSGAMLHCCGSSPKRKQNAASTKLAAPSLFLVGPTTIKHFFLLNQTVLCVGAGGPHS